MKQALLLLVALVLCGESCRAQAPGAAPQLVQELPGRSLVLRAGWRYHPGDNPAWARPDLNDSRWATCDPTQPRREQPPRLLVGVSWLRLRLRLGDSLRQHQLLLRGMRQFAAWELYLNGQLVTRSGVLAATPVGVRPSGSVPNVLEVPATGAADLVLAVRYAPSQVPKLPGVAEEELLRLQLFSGKQYRQREAERAIQGIIFYVTAALFTLLTLLHLVFYYYNPARRANLYFGAYALALALGSLGLYWFGKLPFAALSSYATFEILTYTAIWLGEMWAVRALYALFDFRPSWSYIITWLGSASIMALFAFAYFTKENYIVFQVAFALVTVEQLRLLGWALYQRRRGSILIAAGFAAALLAVLGLVGLSVVEITDNRLSQLIWDSTYPLVVVPPALSISLFLAREFALDAELLLMKLREVEHLSAQTLAQEQEKQALLAQQNDTLETQVAERTGELQRSLSELRATQAQLIQKEKMASLGELTAGIAHEIQNPLNFVNNFADVSAELVAELKEAQAAGDAAEVAALADDLTQNLTKISQHGQRASGIVRGMLEHSRASTGERAPTNVNTLAEEYLRLAYHGLRAKDKTFNATLETAFEAGLPLVPAVSQDLGRVLLNLFSNAFYAVQQRQRAGEPGYAPTVRVATRQVADGVEVQVSDNGPGIPPEVQAKIFQPFFTTKPSGEGTGLGLSLSYDIVSQGHGGTFGVASQVGQGTTFTIRLPR